MPPSGSARAALRPRKISFVRFAPGARTPSSSTSLTRTSCRAIAGGAIEVNAWADLIEQDADLISLIEVADEIHTLSSLSGFEALIRGKAVHTYGLPFYAGWGLTQDALAQPWRKRTLSLDMLTAGVLLRYPVYWDWSLRLFASPELVVRQLAIPAARPLTSIRGDRLRPVRKASRWIASCLRHLLWQCGK